MNGPFVVVPNVVAIVAVVVIVVAIVAAAVSLCLLGQFSETRDAREYFMTSFRIICDFFSFLSPASTRVRNLLAVAGDKRRN